MPTAGLLGGELAMDAITFWERPVLARALVTAAAYLVCGAGVLATLAVIAE